MREREKRGEAVDLPFTMSDVDKGKLIRKKGKENSLGKKLFIVVCLGKDVKLIMA